MDEAIQNEGLDVPEGSPNKPSKVRLAFEHADWARSLSLERVAMADDVAQLAKREAGTVLVVVGALFAVSAPVFGLTYAQPDMGLLVVIFVAPLLWIAGVVFGCLGIALAVTRWQRVAGIVVASALGGELLTLAITVAVNIITR